MTGINFHDERRATDSSDPPKVHYHRRATDPENAIIHLHSRVTDCENSIEKLVVSQAELSKEFKEVGDNIKSIAEILMAWNNARGFLSTMRFMAGFMKVVMIIAGFFIAIWVFLKTGVWTGIKGG